MEKLEKLSLYLFLSLLKKNMDSRRVSPGFGYEDLEVGEKIRVSQVSEGWKYRG